MSDKKLFIFSAPSGCGKTSLAQALMAARGDLAIATSHTTRAKRPGEIHGEDYFFVSHADFAEMVEENAFLEHAQVFDHHYGTSIKAAEDLMAGGKHVILDIDWQGARQVRKIYPDVISVFIVPPSIEALKSRLQGRGQDDDATIARRMEGAKNELSHRDEYAHVIVNDNFDVALKELDALLNQPI